MIKMKIIAVVQPASIVPGGGRRSCKPEHLNRNKSDNYRQRTYPLGAFGLLFSEPRR